MVKVHGRTEGTIRGRANALKIGQKVRLIVPTEDLPPGMTSRSNRGCNDLDLPNHGKKGNTMGRTDQMADEVVGEFNFAHRTLTKLPEHPIAQQREKLLSNRTR